MQGKTFRVVKKDEARRVTGREPISTKWVDTNKGDDKIPNTRARWVGQEFKTDSRLDLFAGTPPLEAIKSVLSRCASNQTTHEPHRVMAI